MTNQEFCYWLQGYFEISQKPELTKGKILIINQEIANITQPLGAFTQWLSDVCAYFERQQYKNEILNYFLSEIIIRLNSIFQHVIDNSYDRKISLEDALDIHDGLIK